MQVVNRWAFQIAYRVDLDELRLPRGRAASVPTLHLDGRAGPEGDLPPTAVEEVRAFCRTHLAPADAREVAATR